MIDYIFLSRKIARLVITPSPIMHTMNQSLLDYLRRENPRLDNDFCGTGRNTQPGSAKWAFPRSIESWEDFKYSTLKAAADGKLHRVLKHRCSLQDFSAIPHIPFCRIYDENSFDSLLVKWNHSVVSVALSEAQKRLESEPNRRRVFMVRGGQADHPGSNAKYRPDWGGVTESIDQSKSPERVKRPKTILPGETKLSKKFTSRSIEPGVHELNYSQKWARPVQQVYTYCVRANARYGYIITDEELIVLQIRPGPRLGPHDDSQSSILSKGSYGGADTPQSRAWASGILQFKSIPWDHAKTAGEGQSEVMTVNLALWWLHMMAAESHKIERNPDEVDDVVNENDDGSLGFRDDSEEESTVGAREDASGTQTPVPWSHIPLGSSTEPGESSIVHSATMESFNEPDTLSSLYTDHGSPMKGSKRLRWDADFGDNVNRKRVLRSSKRG